MRRIDTKEDDHLYLQVSGGIEKMIEEETLRIGDKLPSVRVLSEEYGISTGTAFQAYYHLEGRGLIESRPRSGYYVRHSNKRHRDLPLTVEPDMLSHEVSVNEMIAEVYKSIASPGETNFALGVPDMSLLPAAKVMKSVVYALRNDKHHCMNYDDTQGNVELRKEISRLAFNWGGKVKAEEVVITSGCLEAITLCLKAVTKYGDTVAVECPTYFGIYQAIESLGLKVVEILSHPVTGIDLKSLQKAIKKYSVKACVVIPNFQNPLGSCMPEENKKQLVDIISLHNIPLIEDDIYGELYFGKSRPKTCRFYDKKGLVMHCSSISKTLTPGYRIGWALPGKYLQPVKQMKRIQNISSPTITQAAIAHFLKNGRYEYHLKTLRQALYTQCLRYVQAIIEYFPKDTKVSQPQGGFLLWVELNKKADALRIAKEAMKQGIYITPGEIFSANCDYSNCMRLSFGKPWTPEVEYGLKTLGRIIKEQLSRAK